MTTFPLSTSPIEPTYTLDQLREAQANQPERAGTLQLVGDAINSEWATSWFSRWAVDQTMERDPDWNLTPELAGELTQGLDPSLWGELARSESYTHALYIRETLRDVQESRQRLAQAGVGGAALQVGAAILDPGFIAGGALLEIGTAGLGSGTVAAGVAQKAGRIRSAIRGGLLATGADVPIQAFISSQDPDQGSREVLMTLAGGWALGSTIGAAFPRSLAAREVRQADRMMRDLQAEELETVVSAMGSAGAGSFRRPMEKLTEILSEKGRTYFREQVDPAVRQQRVDNLIDSVFGEADADVAAGLKSMDPDEALAYMDELQRLDAEGQPRERRVKEFPTGVKGAGDEGSPPMETAAVGPDDFDATPLIGGVERIDRVEPVRGAGAIDTIAGTIKSIPRQLKDKRLTDVLRLPTFTVRLGASKDSATRVFGAGMLKENLLRRGDEPIHLSAEEWVKQKRRGSLAVYNRQTGQAFENFNARRSPDARLTRQDFMRTVIESQRSVLKDADPDIATAVEANRKILAKIGQMGKDHRLPGFEDFEPDPFYVPRHWNTNAVHAIDGAHGGGLFNDLVRAAVVAKNPDLDEKVIDKVVKGFTESVRGLNTWSARAKAAMLSGTDADDLAEMLRAWGLPDADVEQVLYRVSPRDPEAGKVNRAKHRLRLDENAQVTAPDGSVVTLQQLLESDADAIMESYTREMFGAMGAQEVYRAVGLHVDPEGSVAIKTWKQMEGILGKRLEEAGHTPEEIEDILKVAEMSDRWVRGLPLRDRVAGKRFFDRTRQVGFLAYSGGFGATQQIEWGGLIAEAGVRAMVLQMPALKSMFRKGADGLLDRRDFQIIEAWSGMATDSVNSRYLDHFDYKTLEHPVHGDLDRGMQRFARAASYANGMIPTLVLQKRASILLATQKWLDIAKSGKIPNKLRLATMGLTKEDAAAIAAGVKKHAKTTQTALGERFDELDLDTWLARDPDTAAKYINALDKWSTRVIQEGDLGSMMPWTTAPWGQVVTQFKTFVLNAWEKQFLHRAQVHDFPAFFGAMWTTMLSGLVYVGRTHIQSIGREDRDEYLAERLTLANIAGGAARYAGWASFMPDVIGTLLPAKYQVFNRNSGLSADIFDIGMAPVPSLFGNAAKAAGSLLTSPFDGDLVPNQREWNAYRKLLPFQTYFGVRNLLDAVGTRLPEEE